jgi:hypothetical protein
VRRSDVGLPRCSGMVAHMIVAIRLLHFPGKQLLLDAFFNWV